MIFIGAELADPHAHFVTNIVACIGGGDDLIIDLLKVNTTTNIFNRIAAHIKIHHERYVIYNAYTDESFFISLKSHFPELQLITVFSDDEWRHANYDRYVALYSDIFTIAVKENLQKYKKYGLNPFYMQWACNPSMFHPLPDQVQNIDVSFIGAAYGQRVDYIEYLIANGVQVKVFGKGWDKYAGIRDYWGGYVSHEKMLEVIARSKINLNFLWTSVEKERCTIKARTLELSSCRAFQLSNYTHEFENYGFMNDFNIAMFADKKELLKKIIHYLQHNEERTVIAAQAYKHVLKNHTWQQRFQTIFAQINKKVDRCLPRHYKSSVLVLVKQAVDHQITIKDERLNIFVADSDSDWQKKVSNMDGIIQLGHASTMNNETLYMMVFALMTDKSDMVTSNFYVGCGSSRYWIRIIDREAEKKRTLLQTLPTSCLMFSADYVAKHGCKLTDDLHEQKISYIEYPSFWLKLPYLRLRKLRLYFSYHGDSRKSLKSYLRGFSFGKAWSLCIDKVWQKMRG